MENRWRWIVLTLLAVLILVTACSPGTPTRPPLTTSSTNSQEGATLVQERCSRCHPLTFVERSRHTATDWKAIVDVMIGRGAQLTPAEETTLVAWLAANFGK
jgi:hypothetical protein